jgi:hypothetical protein
VRVPKIRETRSELPGRPTLVSHKGQAGPTFRRSE